MGWLFGDAGRPHFNSQKLTNGHPFAVSPDDVTATAAAPRPDIAGASRVVVRNELLIAGAVAQGGTSDAIGSAPQSHPKEVPRGSEPRSDASQLVTNVNDEALIDALLAAPAGSWAIRAVRLYLHGNLS